MRCQGLQDSLMDDTEVYPVSEVMISRNKYMLLYVINIHAKEGISWKGFQGVDFSTPF